MMPVLCTCANLPQRIENSAALEVGRKSEQISIASKYKYYSMAILAPYKLYDFFFEPMLMPRFSTRSDMSTEQLTSTANHAGTNSN